MSLLSEEQLGELILDSIADGVFTVDEDWRITSFNRAAERITGIPREDAIGRPCREVFRASRCNNGCALRQTCRTGEPLVDQPLSIVSRDGCRVPVTVSTSLLRDHEGQVIGGIESFRDLNAAHRSLEADTGSHAFAEIIGRSAAMRRLFRVLPRFAESNSTVLIDGASGTGKELFAKAMHQLSPRRKKPFVAVNCGALPDTLLESELFGYKAGAFTDAKHDKPGRFTLANGGTVFLDEIGDVSPAMQTKLLRVLQERVIEPLGAVESIKVDVRVIAATNRDLGQLVRQGIFREDLFYRVNIVRLELPPLRDRREDILVLVDHFIAQFNRKQNKRIAGVSDEVAALLLNHAFPGNVRELENIVEYAFVLCRSGLIEFRHMPPALAQTANREPHVAEGSSTLKDLETIHILDALRRHKGNRTAAARELGINPSTLFRKIKSQGIHLPAANGRRLARPSVR